MIINPPKDGTVTDFLRYAKDFPNITSSAVRDYRSKLNVKASMTPYIIEEREMHVAQMDVFSRLMMDRIIFMGTAIDDQISNIVQAQLLFLESVDENKDISIYMNSPGGVISSGLGIYDVMRFVSNDIATINTAMCASMAAVLVSSGTKGKRYALKHSRTMIHQPLGGTQGQAIDMEIALEEIKKYREDLYNILSENTGQTYKKIEEDADRDNWFRSDEALEYGLIDEVI